MPASIEFMGFMMNVSNTDVHVFGWGSRAGSAAVAVLRWFFPQLQLPSHASWGPVACFRGENVSFPCYPSLQLQSSKQVMLFIGHCKPTVLTGTRC